MRTTLEIPDDLYREVKTKAAQDGVRITDIVTLGLRLALRESPASGKRVQFPLIRAKKGMKKITVEDVNRALNEMYEDEALRAAGLRR